MPAILRKFLPNLVASLIIIGPYAQIGAMVGSVKDMVVWNIIP